MNDENLIPLDQRTKSAQREIQSKGGKVSAQNRRERKKMREDLLALLDTKLTNDEGKKVTVQKEICQAWIEQALKGNMMAIKELRDTIGEVVVQKQEVSSTNIQKVFVTQDDIEEAKKHIDDIING